MTRPRRKVPAVAKPADELRVPGGWENRSTVRFRHWSRYLGFLLLVSIGAALAITFFFCPRFVVWRGLDIPPAWRHPEVNRAVSTLLQIDQPFAPVADPSNWVIAWRLLFPLIWHYLALPKWSLLIMPQLGCLLTLGLIAHIVFQRTSQPWWTFFATVMAGACSWFFVSSGWLSYFDSWIMGGLLVLAFSKSRVALVLACLLIPWIDERFLMAAPLCVVIRFIDVGPGDRRQTRKLLWDCVAVLAASLVYPLLRIPLAWGGLGSAEAGAYTHRYFTWERVAAVSPLRYLDGVWSSMRAGWFFVVVLFWSLWAAHRRLLSGVLATILIGTISVGLAVAADLSRNTGLVVPLSLMGVLDLARRRPRILQIALPLVMAANLLLPASHVLTAFKLRIFYLYTEIDRWQNPPACVDPNAYLEQGIALAKQGDLQAAQSCFDNALKLNENLGSAYIARAMARTALGNVEGATEDSEQAVRHNPQDPDAYFIRGVLRLRRHDRLGAASDLRTALQMAPAEWPQRKKAQGTLTKLNSASPRGAPRP